MLNITSKHYIRLIIMHSDLQQYIETEIIPRYDDFDAAHRRNHVSEVIKRSLSLTSCYSVDEEMVYTIAAYHDTGLIAGREYHHIVSGKIIREDEKLRQWFDNEQIEIMAQAAEDHRASAGQEPRTIYGKIVAEADRLIDSTLVMQRTIQYGLNHYPQYGREEQYQRFRAHLLEKYSDMGYLRLWLPESDNAPRLEQLRAIIRDEIELRASFEEIFPKVKGISER